MVVGVSAGYVVCCSLLGEESTDVIAITTSLTYEVVHEANFVADFMIDTRGCILICEEGADSTKRQIQLLQLRNTRKNRVLTLHEVCRLLCKTSQDNAVPTRRGVVQ